MANQFHSRLKESELHRPERTGSGNPNGLALSGVRDGQYYQDVVTGSLYRYNLSRDHWDLLIDYDADNEVILNSLSQASVTSGGGLTKIGKINAFIGTEQDNVGLQEVIRVFADLYVGLNEGAEIIIQDETSPLQTLSLTVEEDINAGENVTIKVQGDKTSNNFPVGSIILADAKQQEALFSVDPSKVLLQLQNTNGNLASLEIDVDEISSEIVLKTDAQGNIAQFRLDSDQVESSISLNADQIDVQGKTTFTSALVNEGIETQSGAQSKASEARVLAINTSLEAIATDLGYDDFQSMTINAQQGKTIIDGGFLRTSLIQVDNLLAENVFSKDVVITGQLTMSSQAFIQSDGFQSGVLGFKIDSLGNAEFQDVIIGGNDSIIGNQAKLEDLDITGTLTLDTGELKAVNGTGNSVTLDATGITGVSNTLGTVFELPSDGSAPTFSKGVINETIYEISTSAVLRTSETALDGGSNSAGVLINNTGIFAGEANQNTGNANVRIGADGSAFFSGGIVAGSGSIDGPNEVTTLFDVDGNIAKYGDVNLNGVITFEDAQITARGAIGLVNLSSYQQYIADVTENGEVSAFDASKILRHISNAGDDGEAGEDAIDANNPFYTNCKLEFNTDDSFMQGTGEDRDSNTETFFRIAPFNSFINLLRTDFLSSEYLYAETVRPNAIVGAPELTLDTSFSEYIDPSIVDKVGRTDVFGAIKIDNENNSDGDPATGIESFGLDVIGDTRLQGELRFDGTTHASASSGSNGDVPNQVVGYIQINVGGTDYKVPYYA